jgi:hypothetical protein
MTTQVGLAYCGLKCDTCPIFMMTLETDAQKKQTMREDIARQCSEYYKMDLTPDDVSDCDGCMADTGRLFAGCNQCEIRKCAISHGVGSCAYCDDYACEVLKKHFSLDPEARNRLEEIRHYDHHT